jgi:hypothetical protein
MRREKQVGSSNEVSLSLELGSADDLALVRSVDFAELAIVSEVQAVQAGDGATVRHPCPATPAAPAAGGICPM